MEEDIKSTRKEGEAISRSWFGLAVVWSANQQEIIFPKPSSPPSISVKGGWQATPGLFRESKQSHPTP